MENQASNLSNTANTSNTANAFRRLFQLDVTNYVEKKGQFAYLSWPFAVAQLRLTDPGAYWEVKRFDGLPYLSTDLGFFVEVAVTVQGVTLSQIHPVLDNKNRPILAPSAFEINTSIQRCLVKAIALHGLGLNVYAGEDLPDLDEGIAPTKQPEPAAVPAPKRPAKVSSLPVREGRTAADPQPVRSDWLTDAQLRYVQKLIAETGTASDQLLAYFGFDSLDSIPKSEANRVIKALESKRRAA
jgi:hypothetical protein